MFKISGKHAHSVVFKIGNEEYTLIWAEGPMRDEDGNTVLTEIDSEKRLMILSPECTKRQAMSGALSMYMYIWGKQGGSSSSADDEGSAVIAARLERFLQDVGSTDEVVDKLIPPKRINPGGNIMSLLALAALIGIAAFACWSYWYTSTASSPDKAIDTLQVSDSYLSGATLVQAPLKNSLSVPRIHPHDPVAVTAEGRSVWLVEPNGSRRPLATLPKVIHGIQISGDGETVAISDVSKRVHCLSLEAGLEYSSEPMPTFPAEAHCWQGSIVWMDVHDNTWLTNPKTGETEQWFDVSRVVPSESHPSLIGVEQSGSFELRTSTNTTLLQHVVGQGRVVSIDATGDLDSIVLATDSGELIHYRRGHIGYLSRTLQTPVKGGDAKVRIGPSGRFAYIADEKLYRVDLNEMALSGGVDTGLPLGDKVGGIMIGNDLWIIGVVHKDGARLWRK